MLKAALINHKNAMTTVNNGLLAEGLNLYQYAKSNPLKYTNPLGLYTEVGSGKALV
jgi:hypothetical protein